MKGSIVIYYMEIPQLLENAIEEQIKDFKIVQLKKVAKNLSNKYMNNKKTGETFILSKIDAVAYSIMRMPATFGAVLTCLNHISEITDIKIESVLDVGAGTGAATWAVDTIFNVENITCIERDKIMQKVGKNLMESKDTLKNVNWISKDIVKESISQNSDLVITSYMLNEFKEDTIIEVVEKLINATNKILLIIEPGTPEGFKIIKKIKEYTNKKELNVIAPCVYKEECPLDEDDWCHSTCRIQRTKIHKMLKEGQVPYEDEKFSYIAISKEKINIPKSRILRHPVIGSGFVKLSLCTENGIENITISKKDGELYKKAKKKNCGDILM